MDLYTRIQEEVVKRVSLTRPNIGCDPSGDCINEFEQYLQNRLCRDGNTSIMFCMADGSKFTPHPNTACHAGMRSSCGFDLVVDLFQTLNINNGYTKEHKRLFLDYIMNRSVFSDGFVYKDVDVAIKDGFTVRDLTQPANLTQTGLILTRALHHDFSQDHLINSFGLLVDAGLHEDVALVFAGYMRPVQIGEVNITSFDHGHCWWDSYHATKNHLDNYINRKMAPTGSFKSGATYAGVYRLFSGGTYDKTLYDWLQEEVTKTGISKAVTSTNPFNTKLKAVFNVNDCVAALVTIGNKFYKEHKK